MSLPEDLAEAVRAHVGRGGFSAFIANALEQQLAMDTQREIVAEFEKRNDPLTPQELEEADRLLRPRY